MGRVIKLLIGIAIGALCLWLAFRGVVDSDRDTGVGWNEIFAQITATKWWGHASLIGMFITQFVIRTERWRIQVRGLTGVAPPFRASLAVNAVSFAAIFLLPFRLGEFVRPNLAKQKGWLPATQGLAATALERVADGMVTTGFFGVVLLLIDREVPAYVRLGGWTALAVFGGALIVFIVAFRVRDLSTRITERILRVFHGRFAEKVAALMRGFLEGLACFKRPRDLLAYLALTVSFWLLNGYSLYLLMIAMGIDVGVIGGYFVVCFLVIGAMIPAPPGNVGNFHAFARAGLAVLGVGLAPSVAFAILLHAESAFVLIGWAALWIALGDVSLAGVKEATHSADTPEAPR